MKDPVIVFIKVFLFLTAIVLFGIVGFMFLEDYSFLDAVYMTVQVVSTVGFNEVVPFHGYGKVFTIVLIALSFGTFAYGVAQVSQIVLNGSLKNYLKYRTVQKRMDRLSGHIIVCGYGRNGKQAANTLEAYGVDFVVIESEPLKTSVATHDLIITGDATKDEVLIQAGIERASALICTLYDDADNVFVVISARQLNPHLNIISRANHENTGNKLIAAGANSTIMPNKLGGSQLVHTLMKPDIVEFLDHISVGGQSATSIEEIIVNEIPTSLKAKTIKELSIREKTGCTVLAYKPLKSAFVINPDVHLELEENSKIFVLGNADQINKLKQLFNLSK